MKLLLTICLLSTTACLFAQKREASNATNNIDESDPAQLSQQLIARCVTEKEKVTAIFNWITENIAYYRPHPVRARLRNTTTEDINDYPADLLALPPLTERIASKVIRDRRAVCEGYARLFKSLCDHAGIRSQIITGYARTKWEGPHAAFKSNHTWNSVCIDSVWFLLDVTWASGYISRGTGEFIRHYDDYYFLTKPEDFITHHYPDDQRWTLMVDPPVIPEFRHTPFKQKAFNKYQITSYYPRKGIIETQIGDTILLELETSQGVGRHLVIASDSLWEESSLAQLPELAFVQPITIQGASKVRYQFPVNSEDTQWLYVMYNNDAVLRYRLHVKRQGEQVAGK
jgi:hypothetical protein